jgi:hypothetical protein
VAKIVVTGSSATLDLKSSVDSYTATEKTGGAPTPAPFTPTRR